MNTESGQAMPDSCGANRSLPSMQRYASHLTETAKWLKRTIAHGRGGSCAYYAPGLGWSAPYPETTGYLIPTLLALHSRCPGLGMEQAAIGVGRWLLSIQHENGAWQGWLYRPNRIGKPSVFNTGQILLGMVALYRYTGEELWLDAARAGARWLADGVGTDGQWPGGDYRSPETPSYYTHVAWPMLEVWQLVGSPELRDAGERVLDLVLSRRRSDGTFSHWSFGPDQAAFTHTIAYTLQGLLESARISGEWDRYGRPATAALERLLRQAQLRRGRLPGAYRDGWKEQDSFSCLTGNVQVAICLLRWEKVERDLRIVNGAARLIDYVCGCQKLRSPLSGLRGGVAGSHPLFGAYMRGRYPNWSAKYHCDALMDLMDRIVEEQ